MQAKSLFKADKIWSLALLPEVSRELSELLTPTTPLLIEAVVDRTDVKGPIFRQVRS